ncbi:histidine kinase [uncultured Alsobacter sp.]|uniref:histidine kinase n=1 Tax=uncultured Alsobacter sp. TaxID=1748258 RepID=UPI0025E579DF|nr:histidine kinase [uncultured Alsobacter sp.]
MADYYPLISRAVANLGPSSPEQRRDLYERATAALLGQLRHSDPPIPDGDIDRERVSLEDAIRRVETEVGGGVQRAPEPVVAPPMAEPEPPPATVVVQPPSAAARRPVSAVVPETALPHSPAESMADTGLPPADGDAGTADDARWRDAGAARPRPPAPRLENRDRRWLRASVIGVAIALVVGLTATAAMMLKHQPSEFLPQTPQQQAAADANAKIQDRLGGDAPSATAATDPSRPAAPNAGGGAAPSAGQPPQQTASIPAPQQAAPIGVLQRVILIEEPPEGSQEVRQTQGRVRWRLDSVSSGPGEPLDAAVRADVDLPDAGLKVDLLIRRNRDAALPASHTIELKFAATASSPTGPVRDVGVPEMRQDEGQRGTPLAGIAVPVTDNLFLTGLSSLSSDVQRNLDLMRGRNWFMVPLRFATGRRAVLLVEKGATGGRTLADALQAWQQG